MKPALPIRLAAENVTAAALALAPREGRRQAVDLDETALRTWLKNFSALPALEAEDIGAQLHLAQGAHQLAVRWMGGRLGSEKSGTFVAATPDEILTDLLAPARAHENPIAIETARPRALPGSAHDGSVAAPAPRAGTSPGAKLAILAALLAILAAVGWWNFRPATPEGVIWIESATERDAILSRTAGRYASDHERLTLDAKAQLTATNEKDAPLLSTSVRVGRRGTTTVFVTAAGVVIELSASGNLRIAATDYRRVAAGG